ncbi:hypothetical protein NLJ89_g8080 [Agrocybe chaxingu]|uniref:Cytochrome P450 n=1 Tax=Agrocybe chaxingu TaxID=84603 RepID=A0A9W8JW45_9AGAR|nr:hypothetical protein NLJ89_g8080 [Agrocybe chaxingu]
MVRTPSFDYEKLQLTLTGDIMHVDAMGQALVIVSSPNIAQDLLDKRSSVYSDRPHFDISAALTLYLAIILNPVIQAKAQAKLDNVVGKDRLPDIADRPSLPYDDVYEGYFIPKGSIVMPNIWHMLHDLEVYPNPGESNPDRFNGSDIKMEKGKDLVFGFGRRVCTGRYFAEATLFAIVSTMLATCEVLPGQDADGKEVLPEFAYSSGAIITVHSEIATSV